jgi:hypothetical protein
MLKDHKSLVSILGEMKLLPIRRTPFSSRMKPQNSRHKNVIREKENAPWMVCLINARSEEIDAKSDKHKGKAKDRKAFTRSLQTQRGKHSVGFAG